VGNQGSSSGIMSGLSPVAGLCFAGTAATFLLAFHVFRRWRHRSPAVSGSALLITCGVRLFAQGMEIQCSEYLAKLFWDKLQYITPGIAGALWLIWTLQYAGRDKYITRKLIAFLATIQAIQTVLVFTNGQHHLICRQMHLLDQGGISILVSQYGIGFWVFISYVYLLFAVGTIVAAHMLIKARSLHRWEIGVLILLASMPWLFGFRDMFQDGLDKALAGLTTLEEVARVTGGA